MATSSVFLSLPRSQGDEDQRFESKPNLNVECQFRIRLGLGSNVSSVRCFTFSFFFEHDK